MKDLGAVRIGVGVTALMKDQYSDFSQCREEGQQKAKMIAHAMDALGEIVFPGLIETESQAAAAKELFIREGVDIVVCAALAYTMSAIPFRLLSGLPVPIVIWNTQVRRKAPPKSTIEMMWCDSGLAGVPGTTHVLMRAGIRFAMVTSHVEDGRGIKEIGEYARAAQTAHFLRRARVSTVGHVYNAMTDLMADHEDLHLHMGPLTVPVDLCRISEAGKAVSENEIKAMVRADCKRFGKIEAGEAALMASGRLALAMDKVLREEEQADAVALFDMAFLPDPVVGTIPTYGYMHLNEKGIPCTGEVDVVTTVALLIQECLMGPAMIAEFYDMDFDADAVVVCHDSNGNPALAADPKDVLLAESPLFAGELGAGVVCEFVCPPGDVTFLSVVEIDNRWRLIVSEGKSVPTEPRPLRSPFVLFKHEHKSLSDFANDFCRTGSVHHFGLAYGKGAERIAKLGEVMGLETVVV